MLFRSHSWTRSLSPQWEVISEIRFKKVLLHRAAAWVTCPSKTLSSSVDCILYPARHFDFARSLPQRGPLPALLPCFAPRFSHSKSFCVHAPHPPILHTLDRPGTSGSTPSSSSSFLFLFLVLISRRCPSLIVHFSLFLTFLIFISPLATLISTSGLTSFMVQRISKW